MGCVGLSVCVSGLCVGFVHKVVCLLECMCHLLILGMWCVIVGHVLGMCVWV